MHINELETESLISEFKRLCFFQNINAGEMLNLHSKHSEQMYLLEFGDGYLYKVAKSKKRQITRLVFSQDLIEGERNLSFYAVSNCRLLMISKVDFEALTQSSTKFSNLVSNSFREEKHEIKSHVTLVGHTDSLERVSGFLLFLMKKKGVQEGGIIENGLNRNDIGDYLGLTFETVSRKISSLKKMGAIDVSHQNFKILDKTLLLNISKDLIDFEGVSYL